MFGDMNKMMKKMGIDFNNFFKDMFGMDGMDMFNLEGMMG